MITVTGLAHVGIRVRAFDRSVEFYRALGFEMVRKDCRERVAALRHVSGLELNLLDLASTDPDGRNVLMDVSERYPGITHIALQVRDIWAAHRAVRNNRLAVTEGPVTFGDGSTSIFVRDPDGNVIELSQPPLSLHDQPPRAIQQREETTA